MAYHMCTHDPNVTGQIMLHTFDQRTYAVTENEGEIYPVYGKINITGFAFLVSKALSPNESSYKGCFLKILKDIN